MTPALILEQITADGVQLALSTSGGIKASGEHGSVTRWLSIIREHKPGIVAALAQRDWLAAWRELAALTHGLTTDDPRFAGVMVALTQCDEAYRRGDGVAFRHVAEQVRRAMAGRHPQ